MKVDAEKQNKKKPQERIEEASMYIYGVIAGSEMQNINTVPLDCVKNILRLLGKKPLEEK